MGTQFINLVGLTTEFKGQPPPVPIAEGVDIELLKAGDPDPMFVTLKVAEVDAVSGNGRYYDAAFVKSLREQILAKRPGANQGHIPDEQRATAYPTPTAYWIGAIQDNNVLWAKAYVPQGSPMREEIRIRKATGGLMATSIYGVAEQKWDGQRNAYRVENFTLESIDFAPAERAGVASLATTPHVTRETKEEEDKAMGEKPIHEVIGEMTLDHVKFMPKTVVETIVQGSGEYQLVAELRGLLGEKADLVAEVKALRQAKVDAEKAAVDAAVVTEINAAVLPRVLATDKEDDPVKSVRTLVGELVRGHNPANPQAVKDAVAKVVALPHVSALIKAVVVQEMGPAQKRQTGQGQQNGEQFFSIPKVEEK